VPLAAPVHRILEVLQGAALALDPDAPKPLLGFVTAQDGPVAVLDLAARLDLKDARDEKQEAKPDGEENRKILVISASGRRLGLQVDEVVGILSIEEGAVQPLPKGLWRAGTDHLLGLYSVLETPEEQEAAFSETAQLGGVLSDDAFRDGSAQIGTTPGLADLDEAQEGSVGAPSYSWWTLLNVDFLLEEAPPGTVSEG